MIIVRYLLTLTRPHVIISDVLCFLPITQTELIGVNKSKNPLRLNVGYLYNKPIGTSREIPVEFETLELDDLLVRDMKSQVRISRTREGLLLQIDATAEVETTCVRCLKDYFLTVDSEFEELYQFPSRYREETDLVLSEDGYLDLKPLYREYLLLAIPIRRLCKPDCKGLCVICGADLNESPCEHITEQDISPELSEEGE